MVNIFGLGIYREDFNNFNKEYCLEDEKNEVFY